eukprot:981298-Amorphochlora_amoeboformis.AAC.1
MIARIQRVDSRWGEQTPPKNDDRSGALAQRVVDELEIRRNVWPGVGKEGLSHLEAVHEVQEYQEVSSMLYLSASRTGNPDPISCRSPGIHQSGGYQ